MRLIISLLISLILDEKDEIIYKFELPYRKFLMPGKIKIEKNINKLCPLNVQEINNN